MKLTVALLLISVALYAQKDDIKVKIVRNVDGKMQTFEKVYQTREEMANDPELKEFKKDMEVRFLSDTIDARVHVLTEVNVDVDSVSRVDGDIENMVFVRQLNGDSTIVVKIKSDGDSYKIYRNGEQVDPDDLEDVQIISLDSGNHVRFNNEEGGVFEFKSSEEAPARIIVARGPIEVNSFKVIIRMEDVTKKELATAGLEEKPELTPADISYYPNPSNGFINVHFKGLDVPTQLRIYDMTGQVAYSELLNEFDGEFESRIEMNSFEPGMYILEVKQNDKVLRKKILLKKD